MTQLDIARQVWQIMKGWGCSDGAIAGVLGNMQAESGLIPDRWQSDRVGNMSGGYGLVQWTPATKLRDWAAQRGLNPATVDTQMARIKWEADNKQQFYMSGFTFWSWLESGRSAEQCADDFVRYYERPKTVNSTTRQQFARNWYSQLHGTGPSPTPPPTPTPSGLAVNGYLDAETIKALQRRLGTPVDGVISSPSKMVKALQAYLNSKGMNAGTEDGYLGKNTISALQRYLGTPVDGVISKPSMMVRALQTRLNAGTF